MSEGGTTRYTFDSPPIPYLVENEILLQPVTDDDGPCLGQVECVGFSKESQELKLQPGQALKCGLGISSKSSWRSFTTQEVAMWTRIINAIDDPEREATVTMEHFVAKSFFHDYFSPRLKSVNTGIKNFESVIEGLTQSTKEFLPFLLNMTAISIVYGGIHLTAWNYEFPSFIENVLWKVSCFGIIGFIPDILVWHLASKYIFKFRDNLENLGMKLLIFIFGFFRLYIIIESFISLRRLPIGVFWTPSWLQMIPHI